MLVYIFTKKFIFIIFVLIAINFWRTAILLVKANSRLHLSYITVFIVFVISVFVGQSNLTIFFYEDCIYRLMMSNNYDFFYLDVQKKGNN